MAERQGESRFKAWTARVFYRFIGRMADVDMPPGAGDFRLVDRRGARRGPGDARVEPLPARDVQLGRLPAIGGAYVSPPRAAEEAASTAGCGCIRLAADAVIGFSNRPLRLGLNLGFVVSAASIVFGLSAAVSKVVGVFVVPGWTSIMVLVGIVGGIQLIVLGVIGEYIAHIFDEVKHRPLYIVSRTHGLPEAKT